MLSSNVLLCLGIALVAGLFSNRLIKLAKLPNVTGYLIVEELGTVSYLSDGEVFIGRDYQTTKSYSEKAAATIDDQVKLLIDKAYNRCAEILKTNEDKVQKVTDFLLEHETMTGKQFVSCMKGEQIGEAEEVSLFDTTEE